MIKTRYFFIRTPRLPALALLMWLLWCMTGVGAQEPVLDTPRVELITLTAVSPNTTNITGATGTTIPRAQLAVRSLYTGETIYARANAEGGFTVELSGTPYMPYQINIAETIPEELQVQTGALPGSYSVLVQSHFPAEFGNQGATFAAGGKLARGGAVWWGEGSVTQKQYKPGDVLNMTFDVRMLVPEADPNLILQMRGQLGLLPVNRADGVPLSGDAALSNGWSAVLTDSGLPVDNLHDEIILGESATAPATRIENILTFSLRFEIPIPEDLPPGYYVPTLRGTAQLADSDSFDWYDNRVFSTLGTGGEGDSRTRLPVVLTVGDVSPPTLIWSLFNDVLSDGTAGTLPTSAALLSTAGLSNRVRFNPPTLILPPGNYPVEPYLPAQMANRYQGDSAPLLPLVVPGGEVTMTVTRPDARVDRSPLLTFQQVELSTPAVDEKTRTGVNAPVDMVRLATRDSVYSAYPFDTYGTYDIALNGYITDAMNNQYVMSGAYRVIVANLLDMTPAVLSGTPFQEGDVFHAGITVAPGVPAEVGVSLRFYPVGGLPPISFSVGGKANRNGYFYPAENYQFEGAGVYVVDYEARYTDAQGRLWAASTRNAGVVASADSGLIARGRRGVDGYYRARQPWFDTAIYPVDAPFLDFYPNYPYYAGDVIYTPDGADSGIRPIIQLQDSYGQYTQMLRAEQPDIETPEGTLERLIVEDALPVVGAPDTFAILSAARPDVTLRQYVQGDADGALPVRWDNDDPLYQQIGAGAAGNRPGDYAFLYGGIVTPDDTAIYGAFAVVTDDEATAQVVPPFTQPLFTLDDAPVAMFLHPTATQPGQVLMLGNTLSVAGNAAPTLAADITVVVTSPTGIVRAWAGKANAIGYFYDPAQDFAVDEAGLWTVDITTSYQGAISTGTLEAPYPVGIQRYTVYVTHDDTLTLTANQPDEATVTAGNALVFTINAPQGWTNTQAYQTVRTASYVLTESPLNLAGGVATYNYSPNTLSQSFRNLETTGSGASGGDVVLLTFVVTGTDEIGQPALRAKTYTLFHDRLWVLR